MNSHDPVGYAIVIVVMTVVVYLSRVGGFWLIGRVKIGPRVAKMLDALPGAIIAATIAPLLLHGGVSALCAVGAALVVMVVVRRDFAAVAAGLLTAALVRAAGF
jgi:uncharacterized membrane protein